MSLLVLSLAALHFFGPTDPLSGRNKASHVDFFPLTPHLNLFIEYGEPAELSFLTRCTGKDSTRYLSTSMLSSFLPSCDSPHPSFDHEILSVDPMAVLHLQPGYVLCYGRHNDQPVFLFGDETAILNFEELCSFSVTLTHSLTLDPLLLLDLETLHSAATSDPLGSWRSVCGSVAYLVSSNQRLSKKIFLSFPTQISPNSGFSYWLSLCNISGLPSVTSAVSSSPFLDDTQHGDCMVQHADLPSTTGPSRVLCLQDFFHDFSPSAEPGGPFVFLSSLGLTFDRDSSLLEPQLREIFWIIRAFQNRTVSSSLEILTVWRHVLHDQGQVSQRLDSLRGDCVRALWGTDLSRCDEFLRLSETTFAHRWNLVSFLTEAVSAIALRLCDGEPSATDFLPSLLVDLFPDTTPETRSLLLEISRSELIADLSRCLPAVPEDQFGTTALPEGSLLISSVTIHVLMFIPPDHHQEAEIILDLWNKQCPQCNLGTNFVIYSLTDPSASPGRSLLLDSPSALRRILVVSENYLQTTVVENDVVVLLLGLAAIKGFALPGESGIVPHIALNHRSIVGLPSPLLFGSLSPLLHGRGEKWSDLIDVRSIAGMSVAMRDLLVHLLHRSCGLDSGGLVQGILKYAGDRPRIVRIDHDRLCFNQDQQRLEDLIESYVPRAGRFRYGAHSVLRWAQDASLSSFDSLQVSLLSQASAFLSSPQMAYSEVHSLLGEGRLYESLELGWFLALHHPSLILEPYISRLFAVPPPPPSLPHPVDGQEVPILRRQGLSGGEERVARAPGDHFRLAPLLALRSSQPHPAPQIRNRLRHQCHLHRSRSPPPPLPPLFTPPLHSPQGG
jgi:hypothetical protein